MTGQKNIRVLTPMVKTQLGKFQGQTGVCIIRLGGEVLYVGYSTDLYKTTMRYFCPDRILSEYRPAQCKYEVILCQKAKAKVLALILRKELTPKHNTQFNPQKMTPSQKKRKKDLLELYHQHSFFSNIGEHQTDD
jgi:hypothetical protein